MSLDQPAIDAAIERGTAMGQALVKHRDGLIENMASLLLITGEAGLRACVAGALEAALIAYRNGGWGQGVVIVDESKP